MSDVPELDDFLVPEQPPAEEVVDQFDNDVAYNLAFLGLGQGGSNMAAAFWQYGYRRVALLNTTQQDLATIPLPEANKLDLGCSGAKKDPTVGARAFAGREEDLRDLLARTWKKDVDYGLLCVGAGGGTGAGIAPSAVEVVRGYLASLDRPVRVGAIIALPKLSEGRKPASNAVETVQKLAQLNLSPLILVDNDRIEKLYPGRSERDFYPTANKSVSQLLHMFNRLAAQPAPQTTFDRADFGALLDSGIVADRKSVV